VGTLKRTIVIIAGGKGSRSIDPNVPKALHKVNGKSLIENQLFEISKLGKQSVLVVGHYKADLLSVEIDALRSKFPNLDIRLIVEDDPRGTFGALRLAALHSDSKYFISILGDLFFTADLGKFIEDYENFDSSALIAIHPNTHPHDSDLVKYSFLDNLIREFLPKTRFATNLDGNSAIAGIYIFSRDSILSSEFNSGDISTNFIPYLLRKFENVRGWITADVIMDSGTPDRIHKINHGVASGKLLKRSGLFKSAIFIALDDTIIQNVEKKILGTVPRLSDQIVSAIIECNKAGIPLVVVSNQPGIAKGYFSPGDLDVFREQIESQLAERHAYIDAWYFCPHHPESGWEGERKDFKISCSCRKPGNKMLLDAKDHLGIDLDRSFFVGDSELDEELANSMQMTFIKVLEDGISKATNQMSTSQGLRNVLVSLC